MIVATPEAMQSFRMRLQDAATVDAGPQVDFGFIWLSMGLWDEHAEYYYLETEANYFDTVKTMKRHLKQSGMIQRPSTCTMRLTPRGRVLSSSENLVDVGLPTKLCFNGGY